MKLLLSVTYKYFILQKNFISSLNLSDQLLKLYKFILKLLYNSQSRNELLNNTNSNTNNK